MVDNICEVDCRTALRVACHADIYRVAEAFKHVAVVVIGNLTANGIENVAKVNIGYETGDGYLYFVLPCDIDEDKREKANVLLESMYLFLTDLQKQYSDCISISDLEV